jgi:hypothetical protein
MPLIHPLERMEEAGGCMLVDDAGGVERDISLLWLNHDILTNIFL